jgi:hypothetical protein
MEAVIAMSTLAGKSQFERSCLPTEAQLDLHVDGRQFLGLVHRLELSGLLMEKLAEAAHEIGCSTIHDRVWAGRAQVATYAELSEEEKEQYRQIVRKIPAQLADVGYIMRPARSDEPALAFSAGDREQLAQLEHERWVKAMLAADWHYGAEHDPVGKTHPALLPWLNFATQERDPGNSLIGNTAIGAAELPADEKEQVRKLVDGIPRILAQAGYTMTKVRESDSGPPGAS